MISSVGLEHQLDKLGVAGSNPASPTLTIKQLQYRIVTAFFIGLEVGQTSEVFANWGCNSTNEWVKIQPKKRGNSLLNIFS